MPLSREIKNDMREILRALASGTPIDVLAKREGMSRSTFLRHLNQRGVLVPNVPRPRRIGSEKFIDEEWDQIEITPDGVVLPLSPQEIHPKL